VNYDEFDHQMSDIDAEEAGPTNGTIVAAIGEDGTTYQVHVLDYEPESDTLWIKVREN
jgi:hypothetical protein